MPNTAEQLMQKNQEGLMLLLKLLTKLGVSHRELARRLGVSAPMFSYWAHGKLRMSPEDQTTIYGVFAQAVTQRWPEDDEARQHELIPLMEQLVQTWKEATALQHALNAEVEDTHLKGAAPLVLRKVKTIQEWHAFEEAHEIFRKLRQAQLELAMTQDAWDKADEVIAKAKALLGSAPAPAQPQRTRPRPLRRRSQRQLRRRGAMHV